MQTKDEVANRLARIHFEVEPGITRIFKIRDKRPQKTSALSPVILLEVNAATVPSGVMPLYFGPAPASGIPYPSVIIEVTPEEFERIKAKKLKLPKGWALGPEVLKDTDADGDK